MPMIRCDADEHYFDDSKHSSCPFCGNSRTEEDKTVVKFDRGNRDKTVIRDNPNSTPVKMGKKEEKPMKTNSDNPKTIAPWQRKKVSSEKETSNSKASFNGAPVVGWLVIVVGEHQGEDFRIIPGINTVGRGTDNTIVIDTGDAEISRDKHCIIEYDVKNSKFYVERGTTTTYLNDSRVGGDGTELKVGDIIELGMTKLKFIPFCSSDFCWDM